MNSNQRSQVNNQTDNGANEKHASSSRSGVDENNLRAHELSKESQHDASMQSAEPQDDPSWGRDGKAQPTGMSGQSTQGGQPHRSDLSSSGMKGRGQEGQQGPGMPNEQRRSQTGMQKESLQGSQQGLQETSHGRTQQNPAGNASTDRTGSQTGSEQYSPEPTIHQSNDAAGGLPKSPRGKHLAADQKMDEDTGLSNTVNRQSPINQSNQQVHQSNVGRRSDLTED